MSRNRVLNARIRESCAVNKCRDERNDEGVLRWLSHGERMERDAIGKRVYAGECASSPSVGRPLKR